jgi:hypothetical protein
MEKKPTTIILGQYEVELTDPNMSYEDAVTALEDLLMEQMEASLAGEQLLRLFYYFDTDDQPLSPIDFFSFWSNESPMERLEWLNLADTLVFAKEN